MSDGVSVFLQCTRRAGGSVAAGFRLELDVEAWIAKESLPTDLGKRVDLDPKPFLLSFELLLSGNSCAVTVSS